MNEEIIKNLYKWADEFYGVKCRDFDINCQVCTFYMALSILEDSLWLTKEE